MLDNPTTAYENGDGIDIFIDKSGGLSNTSNEYSEELSMNKTTETKRSASSWLMELAEGMRGEYALSIITALLGVACSLIPYFLIIRIITALVNGTAELTQCLTLCA